MNATNPIICNQDREELEEKNFTPEEIGRIEAFITPFCATARLYLVRVFVRCRLRKKTFQESLDLCTQMWEETWSKGTPGRLGDTDDTAEGGIGINNTSAFYWIYHQVGLKEQLRPKFLF